MSDLNTYMSYRKIIRKKGGLSDEQFEDLLNLYYNEYIHEPNKIPIKVWKNQGKNDDRTLNMAISSILKSSTDENVLISRYPFIFKLLTSLYVNSYTAYQIIKSDAVDKDVIFDIEIESGENLKEALSNSDTNITIGAHNNVIYITVK